MSLPFSPSSVGGAVATLYSAGAGLRAWLYHHEWIPQMRLRTKVISIGNIAWGGTGKTPFTIWLAERLTAAGLRVSILTRGYKRSSTESLRVLPPGTDPAEARNDGDEVQLYVRHLGNVPIGIAASRHEAGRAIEAAFPVDLHLLDDGFQHLSLARDLDIVLIDARNPWGARAAVCRLLRESPRALGRADAILVTNAGRPGNGQSEQLDSLKAALNRLNPGVPQFTASTRLLRFADLEGRNACSLDAMKGRRTVAFCGLGNPDNFFAMLAAAGIPLAARKVFPDHHGYTDADLQQLERLVCEAGADGLITTEKDLVNLPPTRALSTALCWAAIELVVDEEERLMAWLGKNLALPLERLATGTPGASPRREPRVDTARGIAQH